MTHWAIDKAGLGHLLDAIRLGLDELRDETIARGTAATGLAKNGAQVYAHLRRLRTYLQRFVAIVGDAVDLDLTEEDQNLIASCALHEVGRLDRTSADPGRRDWSSGSGADDRREILGAWCARLATRRIEPLTAAANQGSSAVQAIQRDIQHRLMAGPDGVGLALVQDLSSDLRVPAPIGQASPAPAAPTPPPVAPRPAWRPDPALGDSIAAARLHAGISPSSPQLHSTLPAEPAPSRRAGVAGFDPRYLADPRLRAMLELDIAAFVRARDAGDHRLGIAHLGSIIEAAAIDFGLANRQRFTLGGSPEAWNLETIIGKLLENHFTPVNPNALRFLDLARTILRPALNLAAAVTITPAILEEFEEFTYRILTAVAAAQEAD